MTRWMLRLAFTLPLLFAAVAHADDLGTPDQAKAMALNAAQLLRSEGADKAFPEFDKGAAFHDRDLYVMVYNGTGTCLAHGANPALIGKLLIGLKDPDGKLMVKDLVSVQDAGWIDYKWPHPVTKKIEPKSTYVVHVGDYYIGVGAYRMP